MYGDPAAAERYSEARIHKFAEEVLLSNINKNIVDFVPNFDNTLEEPIVLPSILPMILVNGSLGIAAGYATNQHPHNINEVIDETIKYIKDNNYQIKLLPDYPTGGVIINKRQVEEAYTTGKSKAIIRARITKNEKKHELVISEIPYLKTSDKLIESIQNVANDRIEKGNKIPKKIEGIKNIKNLSEKGKINIIIEVKKGYELDLIENQLYKYTNCQFTLPMDFNGVIDKKFINFTNVNQIVAEWLNFRIVTLRRLFTNDLKDAKKRIHIIDGLLTALGTNLDRLLDIIRTSKSRSQMVETIVKEFKIEEDQAEYIVNMKLYRINNIEIDQLKKERKDLEKKYNDTVLYFKDDNKINEYIISELENAKKKFGCERKTTVLDLNIEDINNKENLIIDSNHTFICTNRYIKKLNNTIKVQKRGGKGNSIGKIKSDDNPITIFNANNKDNILIFTNAGKVYSRKAYEIEGCEIQSYGYNLNGIIKDETLTNVLAMTDDEMNNENIKIAIGTRLNKIKLVDVAEFKNIYQSGIIATKLNDGDSVIFAQKVDMKGKNSIIACTNTGATINMSLDSIPVVLRPTFGSNIFDNSIINKGDYIAGIDLVTEEVSHAFFISKKGLGKRVEISEFPEQIRGGKGRIGIRAKENDEIVRIVSVKPDSDLTIISNTSIIGMDIDEVSVLLRPAFGNTIKKLNKDEIILGATAI
ncbi:DNA gyrase subunit A [Bacillus phage vB_BsuM-Goe21]|nr:DNA gyrase subunit A [Bacillus phage vB_BsuM-Goe21]